MAAMRSLVALGRAAVGPATWRTVLPLLVWASFLRGLTWVPLSSAAPDLAPAFRSEPLLGLVDVFGGGAPARFSALGLALFPYVVGRATAAAAARLGRVRLALVLSRWRAAPLFRPPDSVVDDPPPRPVLSPPLTLPLRHITPGEWTSGVSGEPPSERAVSAWTAAAAVAMAAAYVYGGAATRGVLLAASDVLTLAAGSMLFLLLGHRLGLDRLLALMILVAAPSYLLDGAHSPVDVAGRLIAAAAIIVLFLALAEASRDVRIQMAQRQAPERPRVYLGDPPRLPIGLNLSGVIPLIYLLVVLGAMRLGGFRLQHSAAGSLRRLAQIEMWLTDPNEMAFWVVFASAGVALKIAYASAHFNARFTADTFKKWGTFIPGVRPGEATARFLQRAFRGVGWIEPILTMTVLFIAALVSSGASGSPAWVLVLVPLLFAAKPMLGLVQELRSLMLMRSYPGFLRHSRRLGGP